MGPPLGWQPPVTVDTGGRWSSLVLDKAGIPHISYYYWETEHNSAFKYAYQDAGWNSTTPDEAPGVGLFCSLVLDKAGIPHISYYDEPNGALKYVCQNSSGDWQPPMTVDTGGVTEGGAGSWSSLALDRDGHPCISYYGDTHGALKYVCQNSSGDWQPPMTVDTGGVGSYTSMALEAGINPHISYYDATNGALKYAYGEWVVPTHPASPPGLRGQFYPVQLEWQPSVTVDTGGVGYYTSLALDTTGNPCISYCDQTNGALKYAYGHWGIRPPISLKSRLDIASLPVHLEWSITTVDTGGATEGDVGIFNSLALDAAGIIPHISYFDTTNGTLKYAYGDAADAAGWNIATLFAVDAGPILRYTEGNSSIALDANGYPHISYYDGTHDTLYYTYYYPE